MLHAVALFLLLISIHASPEIGEVGSVDVGENVVTVPLQREYSSPVVILGDPSYSQYPQFFCFRITSINSTSFSVKAVSDSSGSITAEPMQYMVLEAGQHLLGSVKIEAGIYDGTSLANTVTFGTQFSSTPLVIPSIMSNNYNGFQHMRVTSVRSSNATFQFETVSGSGVTDNPNIETIGWVAIQNSTSFYDSAGNLYGSAYHPYTATKYDCPAMNTFTFGATFTSSNMIVFMKEQSYRGSETVMMRYTKLAAPTNQINGCADEDTLGQSGHAAEDIMVFARDGAGFLFSPSSAPTTATPTSNSPSISPSITPSSSPSFGPSTSPSCSPTIAPSVSPISISPSISPSITPSSSPSFGPSTAPSLSPSTSPSCSPTIAPSVSPSSISPSISPSKSPSSISPSISPSKSPSSISPSISPSKTPSLSPSTSPSSSPTCSPSTSPTASPSSFSPSTSPATLHPSTRSPTSTPSTIAPSPESTPVMALSAQFSDDLATVSLRFSRATNQPSGGCESILSNDSVLLLGSQQASCSWTQADVYTLHLGSGYNCTINSTIVVKGGVISNPSLSAGYMTSATFRVAAPSNPSAAEAKLGAPETLGPCENFELTSVESTGANGRSFAYAWSHVSGNLVSGATLPSVLAAASSLATVTIDADDMMDGQHEFQLTITNWLGSSSTTTISTTKVSNAIPLVTITGSQHVTMKRTDTLSIATQILPPACNSSAGFESPFTGSGYWTQIRTAPGFSSHQVTIVDPNIVTLQVPSNTFNMGEKYGFNLRARTHYGGEVIGEVNVTFTVTVSIENVTASIAGGNSITVPVLQGETIMNTFDGSGSSDPSGLPLNFSWSCLDITDGGSDVLALPANNGVQTDSSTLAIDTQILNVTHRYRVQLVVTGVGVNGTAARSSTATQEVIPTMQRVPIVRVDYSAVSDNGQAQTQADAGASFRPNSDAKITLTTDIGVFLLSEVNITWSCLSNNFALDGGNTGLLTSAANPALVFAPSALLPGATYSFQVHVLSNIGTSGTNTFAFSTNSAPSLGTCGSTPGEGDALLTDFRLECSGWEDSDLPIQYEFSSEEASTGALIRLAFLSTISFKTVLLPGPRSGSAVSIVAAIVDSLGARAIFKFTVTVVQRALDVNALESSVNQRLAEGDTQAFSALVGGGANYLRSGVNTQTVADKTSSVNTLLGSVEGLVTMGLITEDAAVRTPLSLISSLTNFEDPNELSASSRNATLSLVESLAANPLNSFSDSVVTDSLLALGNNLASSQLSAGVSDEEIIDLSSRTETLTQRMGEGLLNDVSEGEVPTTVTTARLAITAQKLNPEVLGGHTVSAPNGVSTTLSTSLQVSAANGSVSTVVSFNSNGSFPSLTSSPSTGTVSISLNQVGRTLNVSNLTDPILINIPANISTPAAYVADGYSPYAICRFWDPAAKNWSRQGVTSSLEPVTGNSVSCNATHLTAFSAVMEWRIGINTFGEDDIKADAFTLDEPAMALCFGLFAFYIIFGLVLCYKDRKYKENLGILASQDYWRRSNKAVMEKFEGERSFTAVKENAVWAVRTSHTWLSPVFRHPGDYMNSFKRFTIVILLTFNALAVASLLLGQDQKLGPLSGGVSTAIVAMAFAFPVPALANLLFARSRPRDFALIINASRLGCLVGSFVTLFSLCTGDEGLVVEGAGALADVGDEAAMVGVAAGDVAAGAVESTEDAETVDVVNIHESQDIAPIDSKDPDQEGGGQEHRSAAVGGAVVGGAAGAGVGSSRGGRKKITRAPRQSRSSSSYKRYATKQAQTGIDMKASRPMMRRRSLAADQFKHNEAHDTHDWSRSDIAGVVFCIVCILGCWFITAVLAYRAKSGTGEWVFTTLTSYGMDIVTRIIVIILLQMLFFGPCCCLCFCSNRKQNYEEGGELEMVTVDKVKIVSFESGNLGFEFLELKAVKIYPGSQAHKMGIPLGSTILEVNGNIIKSDKMLLREFQNAQATSGSLVIKFGIPKPLEEEKAQEEMRRRSRLGKRAITSFGDSTKLIPIVEDEKDDDDDDDDEAQSGEAKILKEKMLERIKEMRMRRAAAGSRNNPNSVWGSIHTAKVYKDASAGRHGWVANIGQNSNDRPSSIGALTPPTVSGHISPIAQHRWKLDSARSSTGGSPSKRGLKPKPKARISTSPLLTPNVVFKTSSPKLRSKVLGSGTMGQTRRGRPGVRSSTKTSKATRRQRTKPRISILDEEKHLPSQELYANVGIHDLHSEVTDVPGRDGKDNDDDDDDDLLLKVLSHRDRHSRTRI